MSTIDSIIFVGTGTSSGVPTVACLVGASKDCKVCLSTLTAEGKKNIRRNTSLAVRIRVPGEERLRLVLIDCGKTFYEQAKIHFPQYELREIDALILTHGHADAMYGLDDLRGWTMNGIIQKHIPIYLTQLTYDTVEMTFPYLVDVKNATGGGDVPSFSFNIIDPTAPFDIAGIDFIPLIVHHGAYMATGLPYLSLGFRFGQVSYISDASFIPESTRELICGSDVFICDALRPGEPHSSHFSLEQAIREALLIRARRTYLIGMSHKADHDSLVENLSSPEVNEGIWIQPAFDGQRIAFRDDEIIDEE